MPRRHPRETCKDCKRNRQDAGEMSATGLCVECGLRRKTENLVQIHEHRGPYFDHWRRRSLAAFGVTSPDE